MERAHFYKHSGTVGFLGPIYMITYGIIAGILGGAIYSLGMHFSPLLMIDAAGVLAFGAIMGFANGKAALFGKIRSKPVTILFTFFTSAIAIYTSWVSYIYFFSGRTTLTFGPTYILRIASIIAQHGAWTIIDITPKGVELYVIWVGEALSILGLSGYIALGLISKPFCEKCDEWANGYISIGPLEPFSKDILETVGKGHIEVLKSMKFVKSPTVYTFLRIEFCESCDQCNLLSIVLTTELVGKNGESRRKEEYQVKHLILKKSQFDDLKVYFSEECEH